MQAPPAPGSIRRKPEPVSRRRPGKKAKTAKRPAGYASHDFLKQSFLPVSHFEGFRKNKTNLLEEKFFRSLSNLSSRHEIALPLNNDEPFPFNILTAFHQVKKSLETKEPGIELLITEYENIVTLATVEEIGISYTLYYPPLSALDWLHTKDKRQTFLLLLSLYAYLNQSVRMPLPSENDYLSNCYDAICDWLENGEEEYDPEEFQDKKAIVTEMRRKQPILEKAVSDPVQLTAFNDRVRTYKPGTETEKKFHSVAEKFLALYEQYPANTFYQNIHTEHYDDDEDDYRAYPDHYFSFYWDDNGWLEEGLMQYINGDLQECSRFEQPASVHYYHESNADAQNNLDFEKRLLELINELSSIIYKMTL